MEKYYTKRFDSFKSCLEDFCLCRGRDYINDSVVLSGTISKFCLTFDLSWKVLKDIITEYHGVNNYSLGSPRENLQQAFACGIIEDDITWFEILRLRNNLAHDYNYDLAKESCEKIVNYYIPFFIDFKESLEKYLNNL